jgi:hypothetical protein
MTATRPQPRPGVLEIAPYVPGKSTAAGAAKVFKLSSNETPLGASLNAIAAYRAAGNHLYDYPDGSASALREAIGMAFGLDPDRIVCGAGSDDLLNLLARAYLKDGDEAIYTTHGFLVYPIVTLGTGAKPVAAPETNFTADVDAILKCVTPRTKLVFLANPNNPTGTYVPFDEVKRLQKALPKNVLLVLDAAYSEYVRRNDYESGIELVATTDNVVMTRTFSKIYGLAGLRIGIAQGVACCVDAGSFGANMVDAFPTFVHATQTTRAYGLINIGSPGLPNLGGGHASRPELCDLPGVVRAFDRHGDWLLGVKVLASASHTGAFGEQAVKLARKAAELVDRPLMLHIGNAPPVVDDVLDLLRPGDIVTHMFAPPPVTR